MSDLPMFAVVVPCHNPDRDQLLHCLSSVLTALPEGAGTVTLIDDGSRPLPADRIEHAAATSRGRVEVVRNEPELGGPLTHVQAAALGAERGRYVHVIHPDDWVLPEFYQAIAGGIKQLPGRNLYTTWHLECDQRGYTTHAPQPAWLSHRGMWPLHMGNPLAVAGCVVSAEFYRTGLGWPAHLTHTADWATWHRAALGGMAVNVRHHLAAYRHSDGNHTARIRRSADNWRDYLRLADHVATYDPASVAVPAFRDYLAQRVRAVRELYAGSGDADAAAAQDRFLTEDLPRWRA